MNHLLDGFFEQLACCLWNQLKAGGIVPPIFISLHLNQSWPQGFFLEIFCFSSLIKINSQLITTGLAAVLSCNIIHGPYSDTPRRHVCSFHRRYAFAYFVVNSKEWTENQVVCFISNAFRLRLLSYGIGRQQLDINCSIFKRCDPWMDAKTWEMVVRRDRCHWKSSEPIRRSWHDLACIRVGQRSWFQDHAQWWPTAHRSITYHRWLPGWTDIQSENHQLW